MYDLTQNGVTWFSQAGASTLRVPVSVQVPVYGVSWGTHTTPAVMTAGARVPVNLTFTNTGSLLWEAAGPTPVRLSYHWLSGPCPGTSMVVWSGRRAALTADVPPGGTVSALLLEVDAPSVPGNYCLMYDVTQNGVTWFSQAGAAGLRIPVTVN
jgi:hypothetical protein